VSTTDDLLRVRTNQMIHGQRSPQRGDAGGTRDDDLVALVCRYALHVVLS